MTPGQAQQTLFAIGAYVIGSATEWQAEAERASAQPLPDPADEEPNARRAEALADQPVHARRRERAAAGPFSATFEYGLDLLITGLRARYGVMRTRSTRGHREPMTDDETRKVAELLKGERFGFLTTITMDGTADQPAR